MGIYSYGYRHTGHIPEGKEQSRMLWSLFRNVNAETKPELLLTNLQNHVFELNHVWKHKGEEFGKCERINS